MTGFSTGVGFAIGFVFGLLVCAATAIGIYVGHQARLHQRAIAAFTARAKEIKFAAMALAAVLVVIVSTALLQNSQCVAAFEVASAEREEQRELAAKDLERCRAGPEWTKFWKDRVSALAPGNARGRYPFGGNQPSTMDFIQYPDHPCGEQYKNYHRVSNDIDNDCHGEPEWWVRLTGIRL